MLVTVIRCMRRNVPLHALGEHDVPRRAPKRHSCIGSRAATPQPFVRVHESITAADGVGLSCTHTTQLFLLLQGFPDSIAKRCSI